MVTPKSDNSSSSKYQQGKNQKSELGKIILNSSKNPLFIVDSDVRPDFFMNFWPYRLLHLNLFREKIVGFMIESLYHTEYVFSHYRRDISSFVRTNNGVLVWKC